MEEENIPAAQATQTVQKVVTAAQGDMGKQGTELAKGARSVTMEISSGNLHDSGLSGSLSCTPKADVHVDLNLSRESGELSDSAEVEAAEAVISQVHLDQKAAVHETVKMQQQQPRDNGYQRGELYVPASLAERMVLEQPPAPTLGKLAEIPDARATLITDRVGTHLT